MDENRKKDPGKIAENLDTIDVTELEDGDLEAASGGGLIQPNEPNGNCGNSQCCG